MRERIVQWTPAFDRRDPDPAKDYGIHGMEVRFVLKGDEGATQFLIFTNWMLPHLRYGHKMVKGFLAEPLPADVGYHARVPQYDGQESMGPCEYLDGAPCYYDGSGLQAMALFDRFVAEGEEAVWEELESRLSELQGENR
jgi:hypothetical protein